MRLPDQRRLAETLGVLLADDRVLRAASLFRASNADGVIVRERSADVVKGTIESPNARRFDRVALTDRLPQLTTFATRAAVK